MKHSTIRNKGYLFYSLGIVSIFVVWILASIIIDNEIVLPEIQLVFKTTVKLLSSSSTYRIIFFTLTRVVISLLIGILIGMLLGILASFNTWIFHFLSPIIKILRALPIASIILIILIMFGTKGIGEITFPPIIVTILLIIPLVFEAIYYGMINVDKNLIDVAKVNTNSTYLLTTKAYLPLIKKDIIVSIAQSIGLSFKAMVMAEYISQTQTSIGYSLLDAKTFLEYSEVYSWTIILIVLSILIEIITKHIIKER